MSKLVVNIPVKERPDSPERREQDETRGHGLRNLLELLLGRQGLRHQDSRSVGADDFLQGRDQESKRQSQAFYDHESNIGIRGYSALDALLIIL